MAAIHEHLAASHADERTAEQTDEQFYYKTRKKAFGPFKQAMWDLGSQAREAIGASLEERFAFLFGKLKIQGTRELVEKFVTPVAAPLKSPQTD